MLRKSKVCFLLRNLKAELYKHLNRKSILRNTFPVLFCPPLKPGTAMGKVFVIKNPVAKS